MYFLEYMYCIIDGFELGHGFFGKWARLFRACPNVECLEAIDVWGVLY